MLTHTYYAQNYASIIYLPLVIIIVIVINNLQRLQLEEFGLCVSVKTGTKGFLDIYIAIVLSFILFGLSFLTSLIHSPVAFHREAVYSLRAITVTMLPISSLYIVLPFLEIYVKLKNLEPILWIRFMADVCLPILILLILFGSSVSDDDTLIIGF